jgi:hypothetical protein
MITAGGIGARVIESRFSGADSWITLQIDGPEELVLRAKMATLSAPAPETRLTITLDPKACNVTRT